MTSKDYVTNGKNNFEEIMENDVVAPLNIFEMKGEEKYLPISY